MTSVMIAMTAWRSGTWKGRRIMDARELTKRYEKLMDDYIETKKKVDYLEQEVSKLRLFVDDMKVDIAMLEKRR